MKKHMLNKMFVLFLAAMVLGGALAPLSFASAATFNNDNLDHPTLLVSNYSKNPGCSNCWASSVTANPGDIVSFDIYFHNTSSETALNARANAILPTGSFTSATATGSVWAQNTPVASSNATININSSYAQTLTFIPGSLKWYPDQTSVTKTLLSGQNGSEVLTSAGLNIGNIAKGWASQGHVIFRAQVSSNYPATPSTSLPTVTTNSATSVVAYSATLNGSVNPNGLSTSAWYQYGISAGAMLESTSTQIVGNSNVASTVSLEAPDLNPNTTYYFRVMAQNSQGTSYGNTMSFTTPQTGGQQNYAPGINTYSATNLSQNSATLNYGVNPYNSPTSVWFQYGISAGALVYNSQTVSVSAGNNYINNYIDISGLSANTTYYFRAVAQNSYGTNYGNIMSFATSGSQNPVNAPTVNTYSATNLSQNSATLNYGINPNGSQASAWFQYGTSSSALTYNSQTANIGSGNNFVNDVINISGLSANTTYYFRAAAQNSYGTNYGNIMSFVTLQTNPPQVSAPTVWTNAATNISSGAATFNGYANPNGYSTSAWFQYGTTFSALNYSTSTQSMGSGSASIFFNQGALNLSAGTTYYFRAVAQNSYGTTYGNVLSFATSGAQQNTLAPSVTTNAATAITATSANLNSTVNPNGSSGTTWFQYGVNQSDLNKTTVTKNFGNEITYISITIPSTELTANTTYYFRPVAQNGVGTTYGAINSFKTGGAIVIPATPPTTPTAPAPWIETSYRVENITHPNGSQDSVFADIGDKLRYTIVIRNTGTANANNLKVNAQLSSVMEYLESSPKATYNANGKIVSFDIIRLRPQESATQSFVAEVKSGLNSTVNQQAQIYLPAKNLLLYSNNTAIHISEQKPLSLKFSVDKNEVRVGSELSYSIEVKNTNKYEVKNVLLSVGLPSDTELVDTDFPIFTRNEGSLIINIGSVPAGQSVVKNFKVRVATGAETDDILTAVTIVNYEDTTGNIQPIISASVSSLVVGSFNVAASIFGGVSSFSVFDWITLFGFLVFLFVVSYITRSILRKIKSRAVATTTDSSKEDYV